MSANIEKQIEEIQAKARAQVATLKASAVREGLRDGVKRNLSDEQLYPIAKSFCNLMEKVARAEKKTK